MRRVALLSTVAVATVCLAACGLSVAGLESSSVGTDGGATADGTVAEAGSNNDASMGTQDSMAEVDAAEEAGDAGPACDAAGCYVIPSGWQLTAFVDNQTSPCPTGFGNPTNFLEGASGTCSCGPCSVTQAPACNAGAISAYYDDPSIPIAGGSNCSISGDQDPNKEAGACNSDGFTGPIPPYNNLDLKYVPTNKPTGGQCVSDGGAGPVTYGAQDQSCQPNSLAAAGCSGNQCTPNIPSPYQTCISKAGVNTCPASTPFTQSHLVGTTFDVSCSSCTCSVTATCNGGTVKLFANNNCTGAEFDVPADGGCYTTKPPNTTYDSYQYVANPPTNVACTGPDASTVTGTFQNETTICCATGAATP